MDLKMEKISQYLFSKLKSSFLSTLSPIYGKLSWDLCGFENP